jgi:hypothetical protein
MKASFFIFFVVCTSNAQASGFWGMLGWEEDLRPKVFSTSADLDELERARMSKSEGCSQVSRGETPKEPDTLEQTSELKTSEELVDSDSSITHPSLQLPEEPKVELLPKPKAKIQFLKLLNSKSIVCRSEFVDLYGYFMKFHNLDLRIFYPHRKL